MKAINAQAAVPTNEDGLQIYAGTYDNESADPIVVTIQTELRILTFISLKAEKAEGYPGPPPYQNFIVDLGFAQSSNSRNELNFEVNVPAGTVLRYFIVGTVLKSALHPEIVSSAIGDAAARVGTWKGIIATAGTSAVELVNTLGCTFTFAKGGTGVYEMTASASVFDSSLYYGLIHVTIEIPGVGMTTAITWFASIKSSTVAGVDVYETNAGAGTTQFADSPGPLHVTIEIFPKTY